jgi:CheY-like chemotaxis protein
MPNALLGRRILVVEDELLVALLLHDMLGDLGCLVEGPAASVDQALSLIEAQVVDAAVLDVNLGGQMSYPVADALIARGVPFVFSSGYPSNRLQEGYRTLPALQKPYHVSELRRALLGLLAPATPSTDPTPRPEVTVLAA